MQMRKFFQFCQRLSNTQVRSAAVATLLALLSCAAPSFAQGSYPIRAVRLIVAFPPGGAVDTIARQLASGLTTLWGQSVFIENKPGGNGVIAADATVKSAPDGYTLFMTYDSLCCVVPFMQEKMPYDTLTDLKPIGMVGTFPLILVAAPSLKVRTVAELVAAAKARPGAIDYASNGIGASPHISMEVFQHSAGIKLNHIPYKGSGPAMVDILGGRVSLMWGAVASTLAQIRSGKLVPLAVGSLERLPLMPEVPTISESGFPAFEAVSWVGIVGPAKMPDALVQKINADLQKVMQTAAYREQQVANGSVVRGGTSDDFAKQIRTEYERAKDLFSSGQIKRQ